MAGRSTRTRAEIEAIRDRIFALWCRRQTWPQIAAQVGLEERQCQLHLQKRGEAVRQLEEKAVGRSLAARDQAIRTYETCIAEAFAEFERSKADRKRHKDKARQRPGKGKPIKDKDGKELPVPDEISTEAEESTEGRVAQAQLLRVVIAAQAEIDSLNQLPKGARTGELPAGLVNVVFFIPQNDRDPSQPSTP
jgi:hypothetical protein